MAAPFRALVALSTSQGRWHHGFHQVLDLPEALVAGHERLYIQWFYDNFCAQPGLIDDATVDEYARTYTKPGAMRAGFGYYRAIPKDIENTQRFVNAGKLAMPVLAVGGGQTMGRRQLVQESMERVAENVRGLVIESSGHFIPEEAPQALSQCVLGLLADSYPA